MAESDESTRFDHLPHSGRGFVTAALLGQVLALVLAAGVGSLAIIQHDTQDDRRSTSSTSWLSQLLSPASPRKQLFATLGGFRPVEGRLSGEPRYAPYPWRLRAEDLRSVASIARDLDREAESPEILHAAALAALTEGNSSEGRSLDRALTKLNKALEARPNDPELLVDLAAVLIERGSRRRRPEDLLQALTVVEQAAQRSPGSHEVLYNRALCLEHLLLFRKAQQAWADYMNVDRTSPWGKEAAVRLQALQSKAANDRWHLDREVLESALARGDVVTARSLVAKYPQAARELGEHELLYQWALAVFEERDHDAERTLRIALALGSVLIEVNGEAMLHEAALAIESAASRSDPVRVSALVYGHREFGAGLEYYRELLDKEALEHFTQAESLLKSARSPFADWAASFAATHRLFLGQDEEAYEALSGLIQRATSSRFPALIARAEWLMGLIDVRLARFSPSLAHYRTSLAHFERLGEMDNAAALHFLIAENLEFQSENAAAWSHRITSLSSAQEVGDSDWLHNILVDASEAVLQLRLPRSALAYQDELVNATLAHTDRREPTRITEALLRRARGQLRSGKIEEAVADLAQAQRYCDQITAKNVRQQLQADLFTIKGELLIDRDPFAAARIVSEALAWYEENEVLLRLPELRLLRARAWLAAKQDEDAELDLEAAIEFLESERERVSDPLLRASHFVRAQEIFDEMIRLQWRRGRRDLAFLFAERSRARMLLDSADVNRVADGPLWRDSIQYILNSLSAQVVLLEYIVLDESVFIWTFSQQQGFESMEVGMPSASLGRLTRRFTAALAAGDKSAERDGAALYRILLQPIEKAIKDSRVVVVVADKHLVQVPFAAMFNPGTGRHLIEERAFAKAPSAMVYIRALERDNFLRSGPSAYPITVLASSSHWGMKDEARLPQLPDTDEEARQLGLLYGTDARIIAGAASTKAALLGALQSSVVVHFAGHTKTNLQFPLLSYLKLAPAREAQSSDGHRLYAHEVYSLRSSRLRSRLLILSACDTAQDVSRGREGAYSVAHAFLGAGIPAIIGSLWQVDDGGARAFFIEFHRHLLRTNNPASALRATQVDLLRSPNVVLSDFRSWASWELVGGNVFE